jgi:transcriptional regulator with XRE-family HTH domain
MPRCRKPAQDFHYVDVHVGKRLRGRRTELAISRQRLADAAGVVHQQVEKYEGAINRVSPGCLYRFARLLNVPVIYFFEGLAPTAAPAPPPHASMALPDDVVQRRETRELIKAYSAISDPGRRRAIHHLIRSMSGTSQF